MAVAIVLPSASSRPGVVSAAASLAAFIVVMVIYVGTVGPNAATPCWWKVT
jgi:hypothetical protein